MVNNSDKDQLQRGVRNYEKMEMLFNSDCDRGGKYACGMSGIFISEAYRSHVYPGGRRRSPDGRRGNRKCFYCNIQDKNGKKISEEDLNRGDIVAIYGDEIMLESYPGQYPGVTKIKVVKEGKASDADQYQDILDEFWPEKDPGELPYLNIGYCASYGEVSAAATRGGYSWSYADKDGVEQNKTADSAAVTQWPDLPVMNVDGTTDMELYFDTKPEKVTATAFPAELSGESDPGAGAEAEVEEKDGNYIVKDVQKDMIYLIRGEWGNGWVEFGFDVG